MALISIRNLFYLSKFFGFAPFQFYASYSTPFATGSRSSVIYCIIYTTCIGALLYYAEATKYLFAMEREHKYPTAKVVKALELTVSSTRVILIFVHQIMNRKKYISTINEAYQLEHAIKNLCYKSKNFVLNKKCLYLLNAKIISVIVQVILTVIAFVSYSRFYRGSTVAEYVLQVSKTTFSNFMAQIFTSIYFCGLLIMLQFYWHLNHRLKSCTKKMEIISMSNMNKMKMQKYCEISDDIDKISILYCRLTTLTASFNSLFSMPILLTILNDFMFSLFAVILISIFLHYLPNY